MTGIKREAAPWDLAERDPLGAPKPGDDRCANDRGSAFARGFLRIFGWPMIAARAAATVWTFGA